MRRFIPILYFIIASCTTDPQFSAPLVQTGLVTEITEQGAVFSGKVSYTGKGTASVGFVWDTAPNPVVANAAKTSVNEFSQGSFSVNVTYDHSVGKKYYVRAYGQSGSEIIYGDPVIFESKGSSNPVIDNFVPLQGGPGTTIDINGSNFGGQPLHVVAKLGGVLIETVSVTPKLLTVKIPLNFQFTGKMKFTVSVSGKEVTSTDFFTVPGPGINSLSRLAAIGGDTIRIFGNGFDPSLPNNKVSFESTAANPIKGTSTYLDVVVPFSLRVGSYAINLVLPGTTTKSIDKVDVYSPWLVSTYTGTSPIGRENAVAFVINGEIYYGTGLNRNFYPYDANRNDFWKFSPSSKTWTRIADFPGLPRAGATAFSIDNIGYVGMGGKDGNDFYTDFWAYDPTTNSWTRKADHPVARRSACVSYTLSGKAYYGLGAGLFGGVLNDFWEFNPSNNTWTQLASFPGDLRGDFVRFSSNNKGYYGFGLNSTATFLKDLWEYNPQNNQWVRQNDFPASGRTIAIGFSKEGKGYIIGRSTTGGVSIVGECWEMDVKSGTWSRRPNYPAPETLIGVVSVTVDKSIYFLGGRG